MTIRQLPNPRSQWFNSSGAPLSGGKVYTYIPGTSTAKNTYSDYLGTTANANPVILDSRGEATIYWDGSYKVVVKDSNDVTIYTLDNHGGGSVEDVSTQRSIVLNYSFEDDDDGDGVPDHWAVTLYTNGTQTLDSSAGGQIHGAKSIKFTSTGTGGGYAESDLFLAHEGESVTATWAMKSSDAGVRNLVELVWYDRSQNVLSTSSIYDNSTTNPTSFTDTRGTATAPTNARFAKIRITGCHSSDTTVGSTWFDDVRIDQGVVTLTGTQTLTNKTIELSGSLSSIKAAASGFTRISPNFCYKTSGVSLTSLTLSACTTITSPAADATALLVFVNAIARAGNAVAQRESDIRVYNDSTCTTVIDALQALAYEHVAVAGNASLTELSGYIIVRNSNPRIMLQADSTAIGRYEVRGYWD